MYICQRCGEQQPPNTPSVSVVTKTRVVMHPAQKKTFIYKAFGEKHKRYDPGGQGTQIVEEQCMCPSCAKQFQRLDKPG